MSRYPHGPNDFEPDEYEDEPEDEIAVGIRLLGAVHWRRKAGANWQQGNAVRFLKDKEGSVELRDDKGEKVVLPNERAYIKERSA